MPDDYLNLKIGRGNTECWPMEPITGSTDKELPISAENLNGAENMCILNYNTVVHKRQNSCTAEKRHLKVGLYDSFI